MRGNSRALVLLMKKAIKEMKRSVGGAKSGWAKKKQMSN